MLKTQTLTCVSIYICGVYVKCVCLWKRGRWREQREGRRMKYWLAENQATWLSKPMIHLLSQRYGCKTLMHFCPPIETLSLVLFLFFLQFQGLTFNICGWINKYMNKCLKGSFCVCFLSTFWNDFDWGFVFGCHLRTIIMNICKAAPSLSV